jgi:hypothetical protein
MDEKIKENENKWKTNVINYVWILSKLTYRQNVITIKISSDFIIESDKQI